MLSYEALADDVSADDVLTGVLAAVPLPEVPLHERRPRLDDAVHRLPATPERVLRRLEWRVIRRLDGQLQGDYRTLFHGIGIDFADLREYEPGDDVRHIDWNVTARMDTPYVRTYLEDRELTAWLLLDRSPSMGFGPTDRPKELVLIELATTLARLLTRGGNRVGAILYNNAVERTIPPRGGRNQVLRLAHHLLRPAVPTGTTTDLGRPRCGPAPARSSGARSSSSCPTSSASRAGSGRCRCSSQRHEVVAIRLVDPRELELPDAGVIVVEDAETGELLSVDTSDPEFRRRFHERRRRREAELQAAARGAGVDLYEVSTEDDLVTGARAHRRAAAEAEALMSFIWPQMLVLLLVAAPLLVRRRTCRSCGGGRGERPSWPRRASCRPRRRDGCRRLRHVPFAFFLAALVLLLFASAPARGEPRPAPPRGHGDPRLRRVEQHAGRRT